MALQTLTAPWSPGWAITRVEAFAWKYNSHLFK